MESRKDMQLAQQNIAVLLQQAIGLDVTSIGDATLQRALKNRMREKNIEGLGDYFNRLKNSRQEMRKLVEEVVVPETWFFRDQEPFKFLAEYVVHSDKDIKSDTFRILSIPCSTGEEPYSIAMTLLQSGLLPSSFYIDAVDVSGRSLATARKGFYKKNSFRSTDLSFRDSFFHETGNGYTLNTAVRKKVRFLQGNILHPAFMESLGLYDVVFCRNVLIYFNEESQRQAINSLYRALMPEGVLFSGHSEASLFYTSRFIPATHSKSFAFYKQRPEERTEKTTPEAVRGFAHRQAKPVRLSQKKVLREEKSLSEQQDQDETRDYAMAREMADMGQLDSAVTLCEKYLGMGDTTAQWYYLLGVIRDSQGQTHEAVRLFRKAVYLDPANAESLVQLSLLAERAGDRETAENYQRRLKRIQEKG